VGSADDGSLIMQLSRIGPFALEQPLDGLAESHVLRGVHVERKVSMAIKLLPRDVVNRPMGGDTFSADVKQLQKIVHPGVARIFGGAVSEGQPYLALELVEGESLRERLDRRGKLPWEMAAEIGDAICRALRFAHRHSTVHQRLTPTRVLLPKKEGVKLIGFDCAWADRDAVLGLRSPMEVAHYLAPEAFRGRQSALRPQCDLFSLGVILFECLSGELPWPADSPAELVRARRAAPAPRVSTMVLDCPVWLDALVSQLLACKRSERLTTADQTHRAIVIAQQKAASGTGTAQHAWSGKQGSLNVNHDQEELRRIQRKRTRDRPIGPFYEKAWFLAACLVGMIGVGIWALRPASEEAMFAQAKVLMESERSVDWRRALDQYLRPLSKRFPETKYADEIQRFEDRYAMHQAEERIKNLDRFGRKPNSEAERCFAEAWEYEQFGDHLTAWKKYESLVDLFDESEDDEDRSYVNLARQRSKLIRSAEDLGQDPASFIKEQLERATLLAESGSLLKARRLLRGVISLYGENQELRPVVDRAREQLRQLDEGTDAAE